MTHLPTELPLPRLSDLVLPRAAVRVLAACATSELCSALPFHDAWAGRAFERLRGDASVFNTEELRGALLRAWTIDALARNYFARKPGALGVGVWSLLGTRAHRLQGSRWVDVDSPQIARLRRFIFPERSGWLQLATCACHSHWVDAVCGKSGRELLIVMDESVLPLAPEMAMRLLDDISRRVPAGSEVIMAFDARAPLRRAHPSRPNSVLEMAIRASNGDGAIVRYPRLRFVDGSSSSDLSAMGCAGVNSADQLASGNDIPRLAHLLVT